MSFNRRQFVAMALAAAFVPACAEEEEEETGEGAEEVRFEPVAVWSDMGGSVRHLTAQETLGLRFDLYPGVRGWEGIVDDFEKSGQKVHLLDHARHPGHLEYTQRVLGRGAGYSENDFFTQIQFPATRKYMPFQVVDRRVKPIKRGGKNYRWVLNVRRYNYRDDERGLFDFLVNLRDLLGRRMMNGFGDPLLFVYDGDFTFPSTGTKRKPHVDQTAKLEARGFSVITEAQLLRS